MELLICFGLSRKQVSLSWGVVQPVGHLTVNEDGEGSNPSAPANLTDSPVFVFVFLAKQPFLTAGSRTSGVPVRDFIGLRTNQDL